MFYLLKLNFFLLDLNNNSVKYRTALSLQPTPLATLVFSQPSIYIDGWLYAMSMTSVVCNVPVLSQNDSIYHHSVFTTCK